MSVWGGIKNTYIRNLIRRPIEQYLTLKLGDIVFDGDVSAGSYIINLVAGHGSSAGEFVEVHYSDITDQKIHFWQAEIIAVNVNAITVMPPLDFDVIVANIETSKRVTPNMNTVNTTIAAPVCFCNNPPNGAIWRLNGIRVEMILSTNPDDGLFGNIAPLPNGVFFGYEKQLSGTIVDRLYLANIRDNAGFRSYCGPTQVVYTTRSTGGGSYGMAAEKKFNGNEAYDSPIELNTNTDRFAIWFHDVLTGLVRLRMKVHGYVRECVSGVI